VRKNPSSTIQCAGYAEATFVRCEDCGHFQPSDDAPALYGECTSPAPYGGEAMQNTTTRKRCASFEAGSGAKPGSSAGSGGGDGNANDRLIRRQWGSLVRNTYVYHAASHGCKVLTLDDSQERSSLCVCYLTGIVYSKHVADAGILPSAPRWLGYFNCCHSGATVDLADSFLARGTEYIIGFEVAIPDSDARELSRVFYTDWEAHRFDPEKIPSLFAKHSPWFEPMMKPILYSKGGTERPAKSEGGDAATEEGPGAQLPGL
jgi:hypothetical protein